MFLVYLLAGRFVPTEHLSLKQQVRSSLWLVGFYAMIIVLSKLGSFGGLGVLAIRWTTSSSPVLAGHLLLGRLHRRAGPPGAPGSR